MTQTNENMEVKENEENKDGERENQEAENTSFLEYLDKLSSDEDFVRNVSYQTFVFANFQFSLIISQIVTFIL